LMTLSVRALARPATLSLVLLLSEANRAAAQALNPAGSNVILGAADWVQGTLLGNLATAVAVIAVAIVGFSMLTGRMNWRHGAMVILGCFVLFGATAIVSGIRSAAQGF
jgi:type IV secretory pathway VirB2 component (pilin)